MDNLAAYGSSSDEEEGSTFQGASTIVQLATAAPPPKAPPLADEKKTTGGSSNSHITGGKKKKILDVSFLPQEIQDALARGNNLSDSDSDDGKPFRTPKIVTMSTAKIASSKALLDQLPKPLHSDSPPIKLQVQSMLLGATSDSSNDVTARGVTADSDDKTKTSPYQFSNQPPIYNAPSQDSSSSISGLGRVINTAPAVSTSAQSRGAAPSVADAEGLYSAPSSSASKSRDDLTNPYLKHNFTASSLERVSRDQTDFEQNSIYSGGLAKESINNKNSRKREREIQQQLLNGNVSVVEKSKLIDVVSSRGWDSSKYNHQQEREAEIQSMFSFGQNAGEKMIAQPSKNQHRKHQINSLAMQAAQVEMEMLDAKGARIRAKSETQAKYGW